MNHCMIIINRQYGRIILKNFDNSLSKSLSSSSSLSMNHPFSWNHLSSSNHPLSSSTSIKQNDIKFALLNKQCSFDCSTSQQFSNSHLNAYQYRNIHKLFINSTRDINKFDTCNINSCLLYYSNVQRRNLCSSNNSTNNISSETSKSSNKDDHKPSQSSKSLSIKINLSLLFSNGYFSIRFAQRECLFHFWTPIELVLKMLQEELLSSTNTTAIHCNNIGSKAAKHCLIDDDHNQQQNDFLDQLLIEFDTDSNHNHHHAIPSRYDQIKFGRIEMVAEHYDSDSVDSDDSNIISETSTSSSSSSSTDSESSIDINHSKNTQQSTEHLKKHRYRLAKLMPFGYALLGCNLDEIYFLGSATGIVRISGPDGYQPNVEHSLRIKYKMIDKTMKLKNELEQWHQMNPLDTQTMLFKTKTIDPNLYEQNELVVRVLLEFYRNYFNNNSNNNINNMNHCDCSNITNSHHHHHDGYDGKKMVRKFIFQFLQQEHQTLLEQFQPLQQEFIELIDSARKESRRRFKFGGLFLLSAQLGFVARLTYFEYSWDIMEPVTWIMTYTTMVGSFAYYIITSEEYVVPGVERRMIASRFWKLAKSRQFDVKKYKKLKEEIRQLEKRIGKLRARF